MFNSVALTLIEATITLYAADPTGAPITDSPIWMGADSDYVQVADRWLKVETRPTAVKYPRRHPLVPQYEISIKRVWALPISNLVGFRPTRGNYVLDVVWTDQDSGDWHRETFYGVTISERSRASRDLNSNAGEFVEDQVFDAQEMVPSSGNGTPPVIDSDLPFTVRYVDIDGHSTNIYSYDPTSFNFTAIGNPSALAVLAADSSTFTVKFASSDGPELTFAAGGLTATQFKTGAPTSNDVPRVDFYYGTSRIASVTRWGEVFSQDYFEGVTNPQNRPGVFQIYVAGALLGTIEQLRMTATAFNAFSPDTIAGLKLWCGIESLAAVPSGTRVERWPDQSSAGNDLLQENGVNQPMLTRPTTDPVSGLPMDGLPSLFFDADMVRFMKTAGNAIATRRFSIFLLVWGQDDGGHQLISTIAGDGAANYDFDFNTTEADRVLSGKTVRLQQLGGAYIAFDKGENDVQGSLNVPANQWNVVELELTGAKLLSGTVNGFLNFSTTLTGSVATVSGDDDRPIILGDNPDFQPFDGPFSMNGYVRALLIYDTPPSDVEKEKIRKYLGLLYSTSATRNLAPVDGSSGALFSKGGRDTSTP